MAIAMTGRMIIDLCASWWGRSKNEPCMVRLATTTAQHQMSRAATLHSPCLRLSQRAMKAATPRGTGIIE
jgi:hypothetical protein